MSDLAYWQKRQVEDMFGYMEKAELTADKIASVYKKASRYLSLKAIDVFEKYQEKYELTEQEARALINTLHDKTSLEELLEKLKNAETQKEKQELIKRLEAPAYRARLERLQQLQDQTDLLMKNVYQQEKDFSTQHYIDLANEAYYKSMYRLQQRAEAAFSFSHLSADQADKVLKSRWSGRNYSKRIWDNTSALAADLKEELLINLITGRTEREVANILANKFAQGASVARRLIRTESNFLSTEMNFKAYEDAGIEEYQFLATLDLKTSKICQSLDEEIFQVKDRKTGVNCPPMHPWCRSTTVSVVNREWLKDMTRSALDPATGKRIKVPRTMKYAEWYEKYVANTDNSDTIKETGTKEETDVHVVGKINREIYNCITDDITTDEVIITDERIDHIKERHPDDYERYYAYLKEIIEKPDYIIESNKPSTALILKEIKETDEKRFKTVLRLKTSSDNSKFKNSVITFMKINEKEWSRLVRNKRILYKNE